jgi:hypothetical protein
MRIAARCVAGAIDRVSTHSSGVGERIPMTPNPSSAGSATQYQCDAVPSTRCRRYFYSLAATNPPESTDNSIPLK